MKKNEKNYVMTDEQKKKKAFESKQNGRKTSVWISLAGILRLFMLGYPLYSLLILPTMGYNLYMFIKDGGEFF